jgi:hypothetical protein
MSGRVAFGCWLLGGALLLANACSSDSKPDTAEPAAPAAAPPEPPTPPPVAPSPAPVPPSTSVTATASARLPHDAGPPPSPNVKLVIRTFPARRGVVMWGAKRLGFVDRNMPLVVERPRDSGPLDLVVRVTNYLPVHTRAYTFSDANIDVKITPLDKKDTIYGYKEPLPPDAGVPFPAEPADIPE